MPDERAMQRMDGSLLVELALGTLAPEDRAPLDAEVAASPELTAQLAELREALAILDASVEPLIPGRRLRDRILALAEPTSRFEGFVERMARLFDFSAERARQILAAIADPQAPWVEPGLPGVRLLHFDGGPRVALADCGLVWVAPGVDFPAHEHRGGEWSLNLQGRAREDGGQVFEPGDLVYRAEGGRHAFRSEGEAPYVFAVVLYGGFHPVGPVGGSS